MLRETDVQSQESSYKRENEKKQEGHNICEFRVEEDTPLEWGVLRGWGRELALSPRGLAFSLCQVSFGFMALSSVLCSPDLFAMLTCLLLGERESGAEPPLL